MRADRIVRKAIRTRFLVTMSDDSTWNGLLWEADDLTLVLRDAASVRPDGTTIPVDNELFLPRLDVAYMQRLT